MSDGMASSGAPRSYGIALGDVRRRGLVGRSSHGSQQAISATDAQHARAKRSPRRGAVAVRKAMAARSAAMVGCSVVETMAAPSLDGRMDAFALGRLCGDTSLAGFEPCAAATKPARLPACVRSYTHPPPFHSVKTHHDTTVSVKTHHTRSDRHRVRVV